MLLFVVVFTLVYLVKFCATVTFLPYNLWYHDVFNPSTTGGTTYVS